MALTVMQCVRSRLNNFKFVVQSKPPLVLFIAGLIGFCIVLSALAKIVDKSNIETAANENWNVFLNHFSKLEFCVSPINISNANGGEDSLKRIELLRKTESHAFVVPITVHLSSIDQLAHYSNLTVLTGVITGKLIGLKGDLAKSNVHIIMRFGGRLNEFVEPCRREPLASKQVVTNSSTEDESSGSSIAIPKRSGGILGDALRDFWCSSSYELESACVEFYSSAAVFPDDNSADESTNGADASDKGEEFNHGNGGNRRSKVLSAGATVSAGNEDEPKRCAIGTHLTDKSGSVMMMEARRASPYSSFRNRNCDGRARLTLSHKIDPSLLTALTLKDKNIIYLHLSATIYFLLFCIFTSIVYACCHSKRLDSNRNSPDVMSSRDRLRRRGTASVNTKSLKTSPVMSHSLDSANLLK